MTKNLKLNIKNKQLAEALNLDNLKNKLLKKKEKETDKPASKSKKTTKPVSPPDDKQNLPLQEPTVPPSPKEELNKNAPANAEETPSLREKKEKKGPIKSSEKKETEGSFFNLGKTKAYQDLPPLKKSLSQPSAFDSRSGRGLSSPDEGSWQHKRRKNHRKIKPITEDMTIRPSSLKVRLPISIKDLSGAMKIKSADLIAVLFKQGLTMTLNDKLDDETLVELLGHELHCTITIDTEEKERVRITDKTLREEILAAPKEKLKQRPPVVTFMGHVDHGKTSLIDAIRKSNRVAYEAGAITQHIGAFRCLTSHGPVTILDTPGHEAFSAMRSRGADVTDLVVLVIAGDEGMKDQTIEALQQAKDAGVTILVALNKCDKEGFNPDPIYRALADRELIPEQWGGSTVIVNCSAKSGEGVADLMELIALQAEVLELKAEPSRRARGTVLESEVHKGFGNVATVLVQNGTLRIGDALVFDHHYGKIKTMINDLGTRLEEASPSTPVEITGISGLPEAGSEFIVVKNEKEAKDISAIRYAEHKEERLNYRKTF